VKAREKIGFNTYLFKGRGVLKNDTDGHMGEGGGGGGGSKNVKEKRKHVFYVMASNYVC
jgi:hypothetical protein